MAAEKVEARPPPGPGRGRGDIKEVKSDQEVTEDAAASSIYSVTWWVHGGLGIKKGLPVSR